MLVSQQHRILFRIVLNADLTTIRAVEILRIYGPGQSNI